ncbi:MAG: hypothetical protein HOI07_01835 [Betaproteobacteria bacterium]|nr:hypothetical protein [Betaproteobacteria bacterium]
MNWWHLVTCPFQNKMYYNVKMSSRVRSPIDPENVPASKRVKLPLITAAVGAQRAMTQSATKNVRTARETSFSNNSAMNINSGNSENNTTSNKKANSATISTRKNAGVSARAASVKRNTPSLPRSNQKRVLGVTPGVRGTKSLANVDNRAFLAARAAASAKRRANEARAAASAKRKANEARVAASAKRRENEARAAASAKRRANEARAAANVKSTKANTVRRSARVKPVKPKPVNLPVPKTKARAKTPARAKTAKIVRPMNNSPKNSDPKVEADAERVSNMFPEIKKLPVTKPYYAPILVKIIRATSIPAKFEDLKDFLIYMYIQKSTDKRTRELFGGKTVKQAVRIIYKHYKLFQKQSRGADVLNLTIQLDKTKYIELVYLMYLDMKHDGIISMSFDVFIESDIIKTIFGSDYTKIDKNMKTKLYKNLLNLPNKSYESVIKEKYESLFNMGKPIEISNRQITADMFKDGTDTCLLFDQEDEASTLSNAQRRVSYPYSYVLDKITRIGETAGTSETKPFYNTVSIANLVDPGHDMQMDSAKKDSQYVMKETPSTTLSWNYRKPVFKIGNTTLEYRLDDSTLNYVIDITNDKGKVTVPGGITAPAARKATATVNDKISKFLGDFMQILTTVALNKTNTKSGYMYVLGTGDAMCAAMYSYICDITKTKNRLWFVKSTEQRSKLYGMDSVIDLRQLATNNNKLPIKSRTTGFW